MFAKPLINVTALAATSGLAISTATAQIIYRTVALSGQQAPGTPVGVVYGDANNNGGFGNTFPVLNNSGQTAFSGFLTGTGINSSNNFGVWSEGSGSLALVARRGSAVPGVAADGVFATFSSVILNTAGRTAFLGILTGTSVNSNNSWGIWSEGDGDLTLVARTGSAAPGVDPNGVFSMLQSPVFSSAGETAFLGFLSGAGFDSSNNSGIWSEGGGGLVLTARTGSAAPGVPAGAVFSNLGQPVLNGAGQTAFSGTITGTGVTFGNDRGVWSGASGSLVLVAREGNAAPGAGAGAVFGNFNDPVLNNAGRTAFTATLIGEGVTSSNNRGIWSEGTGSLALVAREGSAAPGVAANFADFNDPILNSAGRVAVRGSLIGTEVDTTNDTGIWSEGTGSLALVAREGNAAPGVDTGGVFSSFSAPVLNSTGQTAFTGQLTGTGITTDNDVGLWATDSSGLLTLIVRKGTVFDVDAGVGTDNRVISRINFATVSGGQDGRRMSLNDCGVLAFGLAFTNGTSGVFTAAVPASQPVPCDDIDFNNNDVFPEDQDVFDLFDVLAGGSPMTCDGVQGCNDIDFNNNCVFPEDQDVVSFFNVLAGGTCP